jgi:hypothetical protein
MSPGGRPPPAGLGFSVRRELRGVAVDGSVRLWPPHAHVGTDGPVACPVALRKPGGSDLFSCRGRRPAISSRSGECCPTRRSGSLRPRPGARLPPAPQTSHSVDALPATQRDRCRTHGTTRATSPPVPVRARRQVSTSPEPRSRSSPDARRSSRGSDDAGCICTAAPAASSASTLRVIALREKRAPETESSPLR